MMSKFYIHNLVLLVCLVLLNGCMAVYPVSELPVRTNDQIKKDSDIVSQDIEYKVEVYDRHSGKDEAKLLSTGVIINKTTLIKRISKVFPDSGLFSNIRMGDGAYPLHVDFKLEVIEDWSSMISVVPSIFTFLIFPYISGVDFILTAKVYYNYNMIKQYEYSGGIKQYMGILYAGQGSSYREVEAEVIDQMLSSFLYDFRQDFISSGKIK